MRTVTVIFVMAALAGPFVTGDIAVEPAQATHACGLDIPCGHPEQELGCVLNKVLPKDWFWCPY